MSMLPESRPVPLDYAQGRDLQMYRFFNQVYAWMFVGLAVTAVSAYFASASGLMIRNPFVAVAASLALVAMAWGTQSVTMRLSATAGLAMFVLYSALVGVVISYIFVRYRLDTMGAAFFVTSGVFAGTSIVGYVTKKDLTGIGGIAIMAFWGLFLGSIVNIFMQSTALGWMITYAIVAVFIVLTAYDTQKLKNVAIQFADRPDMLQRAAVLGSLNLYMDFLNLFLAILRIMGNRR